MSEHMRSMTTAKIFWSGHSQAVRLPKAFRFPPETSQVAIRREGERIILEPIETRQWPESFWTAFGELPDDFERPVRRAQRRETFDS